MLVITDEDMEKDTKIQMLLSFDNLTSFSQKKPKLPKFSQSAELVDLLGPESWILFYQKDTLREELEMLTSDFNTPLCE